MQAKTKNKWLLLLFLVLAPMLAGLSLYPSSAQAYDFYFPNTGFNPQTGSYDEICPGPGLLRRIMPCIKETLLATSSEILLPFAQMMYHLFVIMATIAVALVGALMVGGKTTAPWRETMVLLVKLGAISLFMNNIYYFFGLLLDTMDELMFVVVAYVMNNGPFQSSMLDNCPDYGDFQNAPTLLIWDAVDCTINSLVGGIFSPLSLNMGLTGFLLSCFTTNALGIIIGLLGLRLMLQLIWAIVRSLYIFVGAYIGICVLFIMAPIFVPMLLFQVTKGYFDRWLKLLLNYIVQPLFLFAYLTMILIAFDTVIFSGQNSLYAVLAGESIFEDDFRKPIEEGGQGGIGGWLWTHGAYSQDSVKATGVAVNPKGASQRMEAADEVGYLPKRVVESGAGGTVSVGVSSPTRVDNEVASDTNRSRQILSTLGLGLTNANPDGTCAPGTTSFGTGFCMNKLNFIETNFSVGTVDWAMLADLNDYNSRDADSMLAYMLRVLMSFLMALITTYVFLSLLDSLPFIGTGIAAAGDEKAFGAINSISSLRPPGENAMASVQQKLVARYNEANPGKLGGRSGPTEGG